MSLRILRPGLLTTVQDVGRVGWQRHGVAVGGAMDDLALRVANILVDNAPDAAALELTLLGPTIRFEQDHLIALTGADLTARLDDVYVPPGRTCVARAGHVLTFGAPRAGCRAYLAVAGGIAVPAVLGSRSTDVRAGIGGLGGRALLTDDVLAIGSPRARATAWLDDMIARGRYVSEWAASRTFQVSAASDVVVRVVGGPEFDAFDDASRAALFAAPFEVTAQSDRMGYRLQGAHLTLERPLELVSSPTVLGTVQVPPGGAPIVLMADHQSVGGYPRIAHVITVDISVLAQAPPGARVHFHEVSLEEAQALYIARERNLMQLATSLEMRRA